MRLGALSLSISPTKAAPRRWQPPAN